MKNMLGFTFVLLTVCHLFAFGDEPIISSSELHERLEIANAVNAEKIMNWAGEAEVLVEQFEAGKLAYTLKSASKFVMDRKKNYFQGTYRLIACDSPREHIGSVGWTSGVMETEQLVTKLEFGENSRGDIQNVTILPRTKSKISKGRSQRFLPTDFFAIKGTERSKFWAACKIWNAGGPKSVSCETEQLPGNRVKLTVKNFKFPGRSTELILERSSGLMLKYESKATPPDGNGWTKTLQEFTTVSGIRLPKSIEHSSDTDGDSKTDFRIKTDFVKQAVNVELPQDAFTLSFMGVQTGARIKDTLTGEKFRYVP